MRVQIVVLQGDPSLVPLAQVFGLNMTARQGHSHRIDVLFKICDRLLFRIRELTDVKGVRQPVCSITRVGKNRQIFASATQYDFHEGAEEHTRNVALRFAVHYALKIERPGPEQARIQVFPGRVELPVVCAGDIEAGFETRLRFVRKRHP